MQTSEQKAFPYTEEFRRAKRNSLFWSGLTIAAALGSPPLPGHELTMGQVGFNLVYDQTAIVGIAGVVAIFMGLGFLQALGRIRLHASSLFLGAGTRDVEGAFVELRQAAGRAKVEVETVGPALVQIVDEVERAVRGPYSDAMTMEMRLRDGAPGDNVPGFAPPPPVDPSGQVEIMRRQGEEMVEWTKTNQKMHAAVYLEAAQTIASLRKNWDGLPEKLDRLKSQLLYADRETIDVPISALEVQVQRLREFHDGIYRTDRMWFWMYDVMPVVALGLIAAVPFVRLFRP
jgi:hypothetical protein